ncbi:unnamed protein product [Symbiodinium microadriaticum]|nr:unnamed protein product [Symbiodinium microadriaticum]CAE7502920.1 unnamed protein product [Symbiodinium sp. KB8]
MMTNIERCALGDVGISGDQERAFNTKCFPKGKALCCGTGIPLGLVNVGKIHIEYDWFGTGTALLAVSVLGMSVVTGGLWLLALHAFKALRAGVTRTRGVLAHDAPNSVHAVIFFPGDAKMYSADRLTMFRVQWPAATFDNETQEMWSFGGRGIPSGGGPFDYIGEIWAYGTLTDSWRNASAPGGPSPRQAASAVFAERKVWIFGGGAPSALDDFYAYDTFAGSWLLLTPAGPASPSARFGHVAVLEGSKMWILGGISLVLDVWAYDIQANTWSQSADGPGAGRHYHAGIVERGASKIWIFSGSLDDGQYSKELLCLDIQGGSWTNWTQADGPDERRSPTAVFSESEARIWIQRWVLL